MTLDDDISLVALADGAYECTITKNYWIEVGPNGGYIAALFAHAGDTHLADPERQLRSLTVHYLRPATASPATLVPTTMHKGRSVAFVRIDLLQENRVVATATGSWAASRSGIDHDVWAMPDARAVEECAPLSSVRPDEHIAIHDQWDIRSIGAAPFEPGADTDMLWWIRPPEHRRLDAPMIVAMADALPPPIFAVAMPGTGVPTLDLTVHVRAPLATTTWRPGDWILARFRTCLSADGFLEEDGELWTADGTLVANSRQLSISI